MANDVLELFRQNLKKYRKAKGYSQLTLAVESGVSEDYISDIERGKYPPNLKIIAKLAEALGVEPYKLLM